MIQSDEEIVEPDGNGPKQGYLAPESLAKEMIKLCIEPPIKKVYQDFGNQTDKLDLEAGTVTQEFSTQSTQTNKAGLESELLAGEQIL